MLKTGDRFEKNFSFTQDQVNEFAELSGDRNPLHTDPDYAAQSSFGRPIVHGILTLSVFSQIIGMEFPGAGTIYLGQDLDFKRPIYPGDQYKAVLEVQDIIEGKHIASIQTQIFQSDNKLALQGFARIKNKEKIG